MKKIAIIIVIAACIAGGMACQKEVRRNVIDTRSNADLMSLIKINFNFSLFLHALQVTGQDSIFGHTHPYTILMPDNVAFSNIGITTNGQLDRMNRDSLLHWVKFHILPLSLPSTDIPQTINAPYTNLAGQQLYFTNNGTEIRIDGRPLASVDNIASDGYIHVLYAPLPLPYPSVKQLLLADSNFSLFAAGLKKFGMLDQLDSAGPYTIIAPLNDAYLYWGITLDSINNMDPQHFKKYLYDVSILRGMRIYTRDFTDPAFTPGGAYPPGTDAANMTFWSDEGILKNIYWGDPAFVEWDVEDRHRNPLDPTYGTPENPCVGDYCEVVFLGPNYYHPPTPINGIPGWISYPDNTAVNGVVHGNNDLLVWPDSVRLK